MSAPVKSEADLMVEYLAKYSRDPLGFVETAFPWREGELADYDGPDTWQRGVLGYIGTELRRGTIDAATAIQIAVSSGHGPGKAQPLSLMLHTPDGLRRWGDLRPGDQVFAADGSPTRVVARHERGDQFIYRVTFDDGSSTLCCPDHVWTVRGRQERRNKNTNWRQLTTQQLAEQITRSNGKARARQWEIPRQGAVQFPSRGMPMDAYTLGAWLGDGGRNSARITTGDVEVIDRLRLAGYQLKLGRKQGTHAKSVYIRGIKDALRRLNILHLYSFEKSVPRNYLENTIAIRTEVLRGLLDTDGEAGRDGCINFSSTSQQLARDVVWLARSLGGKARICATVKKPFYRDMHGKRIEGRPCWRVSLAMPDGFQSFYIERKQRRVRPVQARYLSRWIDSIEPVGVEPAMCITVAAIDGLYQINDFIVTHNSALVAWIILWAISTFPDTRGVVTANTDTQLRTKTWPEVAKWYRLCLVAPLFELTATAIYSRQEGREKTWRIDIIPWSERNTEAFAGLHNQGKRLILLFDEASSIPNIIWEVSEGALTDKDTQILWACFGNPTRNTGRFHACFGRLKHRWWTQRVDSRTAKMTNKEQIQEWIADYGEDSDFVRVRVKGEFPRVGAMQFIGNDVVDAARLREAEASIYDPLIMTVEPARFGDDKSVIRFRKGRDARTHKPLKFRGLDTMQLAARAAEQCELLHPDAVFIDGGGVGGGVVDRMRQLNINVIEVQFGGSADRMAGSIAGADDVVYANKRAEMWGNMREWLKVGAIDDDPELEADLTGVEYGFVLREGRDAIILEKKSDMKKRGLSSPDDGDGLALTFAYPVQASKNAGRMAAGANHVPDDYDPFNPPRHGPGVKHDYDPYA